MLTRYVIKEIVQPFLVWLLLLFVVFFLMAVLKGSEFLLGSSVSLLDLIAFLTYLSPQFLTQSMPLALLLSVVFGLSRLAEDKESQAMQALGISPLKIVGAAFVPGVVVTVLVALLTVYAQPWGQRMVRLAANDIIRKNVMQDIKSATFHNEVFGLMLYVEQVKGSAWNNVLIHDSRDLERPMLVTAKSGSVDTTQFSDALVFQLKNGTIHRTAPGDDYVLATFEKADLRASIDETIHRKNHFQTARDEQSFSELFQSIEVAQVGGGDAHPMLVTLFARLGQLLMSLAFVLLGAPLALIRKLPRGIPFLVTLGGYLGFYLLARVSMQLADSYVISPLLAGLIPISIFTAVGAFLTYRIVTRGTA